MSTIVDDVGSAVTIREVSRTYNDEGDATETWTDHSTEAVIQTLTAEDLLTTAGIFEIGDAQGFFKRTDGSYLKEGNRVMLHSSGEWWRLIGKPIKEGFGDTIFFIECRLQRIIEPQTGRTTTTSDARVA